MATLRSMGYDLFGAENDESVASDGEEGIWNL